MRYARIPLFLTAYLIVASLTACGFTPAYGPEAQVGQKLSNIEVAPPNTREEYIFVRNMEESIGRNSNAENILEHNIVVFEEGLEIYGAARSQVVGRITYKLVSKESGQVVATGVIESFTAYTPESVFAEVAQRDAKERIMNILADKTITDLTLKLSQL